MLPSNEEMEDNIDNEGDLSPRTSKAIKPARKGKKQGNRESAQITKVQPKRKGNSQQGKQ